MQKLKFVLFSVLFFWAAVSITFASSIEVSWAPSPEPDVSHYNVYYGTSTRDYGLPIRVDTVSHIITGLDEGTMYYLSVTAVDTSENESGYSKECVCQTMDKTAPAPPTGVICEGCD